MSITIVHASISENGTAGWDGKAKAGDQTGKEVCTRTWYAKGWNVMLHYPDAKRGSAQPAQTASMPAVDNSYAERFEALESRIAALEKEAKHDE